MHSISGVWIPLVTPLRGDAVDTTALAALVRRLDADGVSGFVVWGTTGEPALLDEAERQAVLDTVLTTSERPVVLGSSGFTAAEALRKLPSGLPADRVAGVLVTPPAVIRPSQAGLRSYFEAIADAAPAPLVIYDIPARCGSALALETLLALAAHPRIAALKDCGADRLKTETLIADGRLAVLAGIDDEWFINRCLGGAGAISASAHVATAAFVAFDRAAAAGELATARALWRRLAPLTRALFEEPNPSPVKALLAEREAMSGAVRAPLTPATHALVTRLAALLAEAEGAAGG